MRLRNDSAHFHTGILDNGGGGTLTYGYFSDYSTVSLRPRAIKPYYMKGETVTLSLFDMAAYEDITWTNPSGENFVQDVLVFEASESNAGIYNVTATHKDGCTIAFVPDVVVHVFESKTYGFEICKGDTIDLKAIGGSPYIWKSGTNVLSDKQVLSVSPENNAAYTVESAREGKSLFVGDFLDGSDGFSSGYSEVKNITATAQFAVVSDASKVNSNFSKIYDHTTGYAIFGSHMIVKCGADAGKKIWSKRVELDQNTQYNLSAWFVTAEKGGEQAKLRFTINDAATGELIVPPNTAPADPDKGTKKDEWKQFSCTWNSGSRTSALISIETAQGIMDGASVCIDDIEFTPLFQISDDFEVKVDSILKPVITGEDICRGIGTMSGSTMGNDIPYFSYRWYNSSGNLIDGKREITVSEPGEYILVVSNGLCSETAFYTLGKIVDEVDISLVTETEVCADETGFSFDYNLTGGDIGTYSIIFDEKARSAGFVDKSDVLFTNEFSVDLPIDVRPNVYNAEIRIDRKSVV